MLEARAIRYAVSGVEILMGVDLGVAAGEIVCLVGPNGAGKSTLMRCVGGLLRPSSGTVRIDGRAIGEYGRRELARVIAYVPQHAGSAASLSVVEMVALGRAPHRSAANAEHDHRVAVTIVEKLGLEPLAFRLFGELSGGERQRVLIGRALAQQGRLMLLDEPTSALDLRHQLEIMTILREIVEEQGIGALVVMHDLALASRFSDRLVMLEEGRIVAAGGWREVLTPAHLEAAYGVAAIVGSNQGLPYVIPVHEQAGNRRPLCSSSARGGVDRTHVVNR